MWFTFFFFLWLSCLCLFDCSEKAELILKNNFVTILFPVDRFSEMGPCSRTFFNEKGFTCLQVLDYIYAFYQVLDLSFAKFICFYSRVIITEIRFIKWIWLVSHFIFTRASLNCSLIGFLVPKTSRLWYF